MDSTVRKAGLLSQGKLATVSDMVSAIEKAVEIVGGPGKMAAEFDVSYQAVQDWIRTGRVPADRCPSIERLTEGAVTCEALRPDVEWAVLRAPAKRRRGEKVMSRQ